MKKENNHAIIWALCLLHGMLNTEHATNGYSKEYVEQMKQELEEAFKSLRESTKMSNLDEQEIKAFEEIIALSEHCLEACECYQLQDDVEAYTAKIERAKAAVVMIKSKGESK